MREGGGVHAVVEVETEDMWVGIGTMTAPFFPYICIGLDAQDVQDMCPGGHKNKVCNVNAAAWHFSFLEIQSSVTEN